MTAAAPAIELTEVQHAALAKIAASIARPGGVAVLCGPLGTGTSTVLAAVAAAGPERRRRRLVTAWAGWGLGLQPLQRLLLVLDSGPNLEVNLVPMQEETTLSIEARSVTSTSKASRSTAATAVSMARVSPRMTTVACMLRSRKGSAAERSSPAERWWGRVFLC